MKALEILKENKRVMENFVNSFDNDCKDDDEYISANEYINQLDEAIKEFEELIAKDKSKNCEECYNKTKLAIKALENRSCSNCKHWELGWCFKLGSSLDIGGCGDYWEQK